MEKPIFSVEIVTGAQTILQSMNYLVGLADGSWGPRSIGAIAAFQAVNGLTVTGNLDSKTLEVIQSPEAKPMPVSTVRKIMDEAAVAEVVPAIKKAIGVRMMTRLAALGSGIITVLAAITPLIGSARTYLDPFKEYFNLLPTWSYPLLILIIAFSLAYSTNDAVQKQIEDFRNGQTNGTNTENQQ